MSALAHAKRAGRLSLERFDAGRGSHYGKTLSALPALLRVAEGPGGRRRMVRAAMRLGSRRPAPATVVLAGVAAPVGVVLPDWTALLVLVEVLVFEEYALDGEAPDVVLDLGANIGASALFFRRRYPGARVVAVEASPDLAAVLERNVEGLGIEVVHAAVAAEAGTVTFQADDAWAGTTGGAGGVEVPAVTLDELLERYAPDLLKIDVEGAELDVLPDAGAALDRVRTIVGELHGPTGSDAQRRVLERLAAWDVETEQAAEFVQFSARRTI